MFTGAPPTPRLSSRIHAIAPHYEVVVVGSGYGGGIAASRLARAGRRVCVLERGREFVPGEYPRTQAEAAANVQIVTAAGHLGAPSGLFDFRRNDQMNVLIGCGLGGGSLINAGVVLAAEDRVFDDERWPEPLRAAGAFAAGYQRAREMLQPAPLPESFGPLPKLEALTKAAAGIGADVSRPPIAVNYAGGVNHVGVPQQACQLCGDCVSGCNYGAKNSVVATYLPDARNHGAEIYTKVLVRRVERRGGTWLVHYRLPGYGREMFAAPDLVVRADVVVLAAGALGSTEILLRSAQHGLALSNHVGRRVSGNGDVLAFAYNCDVPVHGIGFGDHDVGAMAPVGPCITGIADLREQPDLDDGMVIEEGVIPGALTGVLAEAFAVAAALTGVDTDSGVLDRVDEVVRELRSLAGGGEADAVRSTLTYLVMAHDDAGGRMRLEDDRLRIDWPGAADQATFRAVKQRLVDATKALGGTYVPNPSKLLGQDLVTVHPLGGCAMGDDAERGVVNHKGQVYCGPRGTDVHDGLYVCDGAIVPRSLGVNPLLTISALAERCCELMAADRAWRVDYALPSAPSVPEVPVRPGISFTERMHGYFSSTTGSDSSPFDFTFTIMIDDLDHFLASESSEARIVGTVAAPALSDAPLTATGGVLNLIVSDPADPGIRYMRYRTALTTADGAQFRFEGVKVLRDDPGLDLWPDTTTLSITVRDAAGTGSVLGTGTLRIRLDDFIKQLTTMQATDVSTPAQRRAALARFGAHFTGELARIYAPI